MTGATLNTNVDATMHIHSHEMIENDRVDNTLAIKKLAEKLSVSGSYSVDYIKESIMDYGKICNHDDGYLCEHRLQFIIDFISEHFFSHQEMKTNLTAFLFDWVKGDVKIEHLEFRNNWIKENMTEKKEL